jgi:YegS/Rv2252/BmrU family lipid kinase
MTTAAIIINQGAGSAHAIEASAIIDTLRAGAIEPSIILASDGSKMTDATKRALATGADIIVAGGGDGTINAVASELIGTETILGVLPLGTLNHFAKALHVPLDVDKALQAIVAGHCTAVDMGEVNGRFFLNNSSIGIYPEIVQEREAEQRRFGSAKWTAFFWATLRALRRYPFLDVRLDVDGEHYTRHTPFVFVGNNEYAIEGFDLGERKTLNSGRLSLYVSQRTGRLGLVGFALRALFGLLRQATDFDALLATEIVIETRRRRIRVATDGEVTMMAAPLHYRIRASALNVIVPAPASD